MYTLDGRMRFEVNLAADDMLRFKTAKLHEVVLNRVNEQFVLNFSFVVQDEGKGAVLAKVIEEPEGIYLPEYVVIDQDNALGSSANANFSEMQNPQVAELMTYASLDKNVIEQVRQLNINRPNVATHFYVQNTQLPSLAQENAPSFSLKLRSSSVPVSATTQVVPSSNSNSQMKLKINLAEPVQEPATNGDVPMKGVRS